MEQEKIFISDIGHADLCASFIHHCEKNNFDLIEKELPYNYYGDRGVIDLVFRKTSPDGTCIWRLCEIKNTVQKLDHALRQVQRAKGYVEKARPDVFDNGAKNVFEFPLVFNATKENYALFRRYKNDLLRDIDVVFFPVVDSEEASEIMNSVEIDLAIMKARGKGVSCVF